MKKLFILLLAFVVILTSCTYRTRVVHTGPLPPGQAKKLTGSKSAKAYAPGQRKKIVKNN